MQQRIAPWIGCLLAGILLLAGGCQTNPAETRQRSAARNLTEKGAVFRQSGDLKSAVRAFQEALAEDNRYVPAHLGLGDAYRDQGDFELAARSYLNAQALDPTNYEANFKSGTMLQVLQRLGEAVRFYLNAVASDPHSFEANYNLSAAYLQLGQPRLALGYARQAAKAQPDSQRAILNLAEIHHALSEFDQAVEYYRGAAELGELDAQASLGFARTLIHIEAWERARNTLRNLIRENEQYGPAWERLGYVEFKNGNFAEAERAYGRAVEINSEDPAALNGFGVLRMTRFIQSNYEDPSLRQQALDAWRKSVRLYPNQPRIVNLINLYQN